MVSIPKTDPIHEGIEGKMVKDELRPYIGMSGLGGCMRRIWYDFHWAHIPEHSPRMLRLFERGDHEEDLVIRDLATIGITVDSQQIEIVDETGHIRGHIDGIAINVPQAPKTAHLLEVKTMNDKRFKEYCKSGLQATNPGYYAQINQYMGGLNLTRCLFIVTNKNTEERKYDRIRFDKDNYIKCKDVADAVLFSEEPPEKIGGPSWFECKYCHCHGICHKGEPVEHNCRTCQHCDIHMDSLFRCSHYHRNNGTVSTERQRKGCNLYYKRSEVFDV